MVIQENVRTAPWEQMQGRWEQLGYMSVLVTVDTKHYYIPQTRERGYLVVIDKRRLEAAGLLGGSMDQSGIDTVAQHVCGLARQFKRQASAPVGMFLLNDDDRRLEIIEMRARLESRSDTSWEQYQVRHQRHRDDLELGNERPITRSLPGINVLKAPDFYWHCFWKTQPERVWETVDMNFLKKLSLYDMSFKE
jgi:site-specific DNA-cytosine methylase